MSQPVSQTMTLHLLWMIISGYWLISRGAILPGLYQMGLPDTAVRRSWQALRQGGWTLGALLINWEAAVMQRGQWPPRYHGGYRAVAVDATRFWCPRLKNCPLS